MANTTDLIKRITFSKCDEKSDGLIECYAVDLDGVELGDVLIDEAFGLTWGKAKQTALELATAALDVFPKAFARC